MSRLRHVIQTLDLSTPEKAKNSLARTLAVIDQELDTLAALRLNDWNEITELQNGSMRAKFGQLVRVDTLPGRSAPHVLLPEGKTIDIGKQVGVMRNHLSPTCLPVVHPAPGQYISTGVAALTLVPSLRGVKAFLWTGATWEGGQY